MAIMDEESVKLISDSEISQIQINRPNNLNALNPDVLQSLILLLEKLEKNGKTKVLTITGSGEKAFVAGADIHSMSQLGPRAIADYVELGQRAMRKLETVPFPVIAVLNGFTLGGGMELALACDLIIASETAKLGQPEVNLGIIPGFGGTQRLPARCGTGTAKRLIFSGELIDAAEAFRIGLVDYLCKPEELSETTAKITNLISSKAPLAVQHAKKVMRQSQETALLSGLRLEVQAFLDLFNTIDREEGMKAFLQKRQAVFIGK